MNSRVRDIECHYVSGSAKCKAKEEKERSDQLVISKAHKLSEYLMFIVMVL